MACPRRFHAQFGTLTMLAVRARAARGGALRVFQLAKVYNILIE
jgi:hypothetical protein